MANWPSELPQPYSLEVRVGNNVLRRDTARGFRLQPRARSDCDKFALQFFMVQSEFDIFMEFYKTTLRKGSAWFEMSFNDGDTDRVQTIRMVRPPAIADAYPRKSVSMEVECYDRVKMSLADVTAYLDDAASPYMPGLRLGPYTDIETGALLLGPSRID